MYYLKLFIFLKYLINSKYIIYRIIMSIIICILHSFDQTNRTIFKGIIQILLGNKYKLILHILRSL